MTQSRYAPAVLAIAHVPMNGGLFPLEEMRPRDWIGKPVTFNHPTDSRRHFRLATDDDAIGEIIDAWVDGDRLKGTIRVDVARTPRHIIDAIDRGDPVDVSTGYLTQEECPAHGGLCIHRNMTPDHLAIVPHGACSWADGCGLRSNLKVNTVTKTRFQSNKRRYSDRRPECHCDDDVYNQLEELMGKVSPSDREIIARGMVRSGYTPPVSYRYNDAEVRAAMNQQHDAWPGASDAHRETIADINARRAENERRRARADKYCRQNGGRMPGAVRDSAPSPVPHTDYRGRAVPRDNADGDKRAIEAMTVPSTVDFVRNKRDNGGR